MVSDATRTPIIQSITKQIFKKEELKRTLNSLECVARGASLQAAKLSPTCQMAKFDVDDYNHIPISIQYQMGEDPAKVSKLFGIGFTASNKNITFENKCCPGDVLIKYENDPANPILSGLPDQIMSCKIPQPKKKHADNASYKCALVLKAQIGLHMIPELYKVEFIESWEEEEKVAVKKPKAPAPAPKKEGEAPAEGEAEGEKQAP